MFGFWLDANEDTKPDLGDAFGWARLEVNADHTVTQLGSAIENYGVGIIVGTTSLVPEPSTLILAALGGIALLAYRRRR